VYREFVRSRPARVTRPNGVNAQRIDNAAAAPRCAANVGGALAARPPFSSASRPDRHA